MIRAIKNLLKRFWPSLRLRTILFATLVFVAALPGFGAVFLRVYENTLVQQTEAELIAQGAVLASAYRSFWSADPEIRRTTDPIPERPTIDLNAMPILSEQMPARRLPGAPDPQAVQVAARMMPIVAESDRKSVV